MSSQHWPRVTANFLAHNRREILARSIDAIRALDYPQDRLEIVVVDNASSDGTAEMLRERFPEVTVVVNERNVGISGWNRGFEVGTGELFLVLDDDAYIEGDSLQRAIAEARRYAADLVTFRVATPDEGLVFTEDFPSGLLSFWGSALLVAAPAIRRLSGFDPGVFIYGHEIEFTMRLLDAGYRHLYLPEVTVLHVKAPDPPGAAPDPTFHRTYMGNLAYFAAGRLRLRDAAAVGANLLLGTTVTSLRYPNTRTAVASVLRGLARGARAHRPVRPELSRVYRRDFVDFASPLQFVRTPAERFRSNASGGPGRGARRRRFYEERRALYPGGAAHAHLPPDASRLELTAVAEA